MNILIAAIHFPVASGRFIQRALRRLGHDVKTVGPCTGNEIWNTRVDEVHVWNPHLAIPDYESRRTLREMQYGLDGWQPDLIITADSHWTIYGYAPCPHIVWGQDNHVRDYRIREWDAMFLCHTWGHRMDEPNAYWLPPCYDPVICTDLGLERDIDVAMLGYPYEARAELAKAFYASGLNVFFGLGLVYDDYNALYNRTKIALNRSVAGDVTNRFLENRAQGCCILSDEPRDAAAMGFVAGQDYWSYNSPDDAVMKARHLIESGEWRAVAALGKIRGKDHTWDDRARFMLEIVETELGMKE